MASSLGMEPHTHLKDFSTEMFLSKGRTGVKHGTETAGGNNTRLPHLLQSADTKPNTVPVVKGCLLTGTYCGGFLGGLASN